MQYKYVIGIDEAGRGPLAGPVSVGVVCITPDFNWESIPGVDDSKKLSSKKREEIFTIAEALNDESKLHYAVSMVSASMIDKIGIVPAVRKAMTRSLSAIMEQIEADEDECIVKLDGLLYAPKAFANQETIIGGDGKEKIIGLASIMAKVTRDRYMVRISKSRPYASYDFAAHKGYGTDGHRELIKMYGLSAMHRKSYCHKLI